MREKSRNWTRRSVLIAAAVGGGAAGVAALSDTGADGNLYGGKMALQEAFNVSGQLWIGPDTAKGDVDPNEGRVYMASDTEIDYYGTGSAWDDRNVGSAERPVGAVHTESLNDTPRVRAGAGASAVNDAISDAEADGDSTLFVMGDEATWTETVEIPDGFTLSFSPGLKINVPSTDNLTGYDPYDDGNNALYYTALTNETRTNAEGVTVVGNGVLFDFGDVSDWEQNIAGVWFHDVTDLEVSGVRVDDVAKQAGDDRDYRHFGIAVSECQNFELREVEGTNCGYEGIAIRGTNEEGEIIDSFAKGSNKASMQVATWRPEGDQSSTRYGRGKDNQFTRCRVPSGDEDYVVHGTAGGHEHEDIRFIDCYGQGMQLIDTVREIKISGGEYKQQNSANNFQLRARSSGETVSDVTVENVDFHGDHRALNLRGEGAGTIENVRLSDVRVRGGAVVIDAWVDDDGATVRDIEARNVDLDGENDGIWDTAYQVRGSSAGMATTENLRVIGGSLKRIVDGITGEWDTVKAYDIRFEGSGDLIGTDPTDTQERDTFAPS